MEMYVAILQSWILQSDACAIWKLIIEKENTQLQLQSGHIQHGNCNLTYDLYTT